MALANTYVTFLVAAQLSSDRTHFRIQHKKIHAQRVANGMPAGPFSLPKRHSNQQPSAQPHHHPNGNFTQIYPSPPILVSQHSANAQRILIVPHSPVNIPPVKIGPSPASEKNEDLFLNYRRQSWIQYDQHHFYSHSQPTAGQSYSQYSTLQHGSFPSIKQPERVSKTAISFLVE
ncbi:hypothetical protein BCR33DRAFT_719431 [Rhizoclosmatium globosum]|uniref:Uncharacterized protein n=1 Tax=Rhizoclosmatium globosum TaxID=329046 RepID=A0A1Y2C071_9FUNG|nr:hypothetical protein BCR33DRAFT_719431 [Rhizoclosmatium globosum]|eukprot:ORY40443.1 hypothetical protein BCR33DRAFT_719431 [Rhizoclosmatium globosum]